MLSDFATFQSLNGLPVITPSVVTVGTPGTSIINDIEWDLDSQALQGMAGSFASLTFYVGNDLNDTSLLSAYSTAVSQNTARIVNVSIGECESGAVSNGTLASGDQIFMVGAAQGQLFSVATGDHGSRACGTSTGNGSFGSIEGVSYPASSPYVVAVGGTTLTTNPDGTYASETGWTYSGGGQSGTEAAAQWEQQVSGINFLARTLPDVAMDADPESGALIRVDGVNNIQVGGTSLAAPLFAGSWARIQTANSFAFGFPNPLIYGLSVPMAPFHDITTGNNGDYSAGANWDHVTGWGSPMVASLSTAVASLPTAPASIGASNNGITCPTARLSWSAGVGATSYVIWREELAPVRAFVYINSGTVTSQFIAINLPTGQSFSYKVGSCNATGCSAPSAVSQTLTQGACP